MVSVRDAVGRNRRRLTLIDEFTQESLTIHRARHIGADQVIEVLADVIVRRGVPAHTRSDNEPEFIARSLRAWLSAVGVKTLYMAPSSPREKENCESFNGTLRNELLNGEIFYGLRELEVIVEQWRRNYNTERPHSSLGYRLPAPATWDGR